MSEEGKMPVLAISPTSWQPLLSATLLADLKLLKPFSLDRLNEYFRNGNGWKILQVLSQCHWKDLFDADSFIWLLWETLLSLSDSSNNQELKTPIQYFNFLLESDDPLKEANVKAESNWGKLVNGRAKSPHSHRGYSWCWGRRKKLQRKRPKPLDQNGEGEDMNSASFENLPATIAMPETMRHPNRNMRSLGIPLNTRDVHGKRRRHGGCGKLATNRPSFVVGPQVVREDADGLPACWKGSILAPVGSFEPSVDDPVSQSEISCSKGGAVQSTAEQPEGHSSMKLDAMVLDMLCLSVPHYTKCPSGTGDIVIRILAVMDKAAPFVKDLDRFGWEILKTLAMESDDNEWLSLQAVLNQFHSSDARRLSAEEMTFRLVCARQVAQLVFAGLNLVKGNISACGDLYNFCLKSLLRQTSIACALLDSGAAESLVTTELIGTGGVLEYLLDFANELAVGCVSTVRQFLVSMLTDVAVTQKNFPVAVDMVRQLRDGGYMEIVHSIAIGADLLSQVNYDPYRVEPLRDDESTGANIYKEKLNDLVGAIASLAGLLERVKVWMTHNRHTTKRHKDANGPASPERHHHEVMEFASPSMIQLKPISPKIADRCCNGYLVTTLLSIFSDLIGCDSKTSVLTALNRSAVCCCLSLDLVFHKLLTGISGIKSRDTQRLLMRTLETKFCSRADPSEMCSHCYDVAGTDTGVTVGQSTFYLDKEAKETADFLKETIRNCSEDVWLTKCLWRVLIRSTAGLSEALKEEIFCGLVAPTLNKLMATGNVFAPNSPNCDAIDLSFLLLESTGEYLITANCYLAFLMLIFKPYGESLFCCSNLQSPFFLAVKRAADFENLIMTGRVRVVDSVLHLNVPVTTFVYDKFCSGCKLIQADLSGLLSDEAAEFFRTTLSLLRLCRDLLSSSQSFCSHFTLYGGPNWLGHILDSALTVANSLGIGDNYRLPGKGKFRIAQLLQEIISLWLTFGGETPQDRLFAALKKFVDNNDTIAQWPSSYAVSLSHVVLECCLEPSERLQYRKRLCKQCDTTSSSDVSSIISVHNNLNDNSHKLLVGETDGYDGDESDESPTVMSSMSQSEILGRSPILAEPRLCLLSLQVLLKYFESSSADDFSLVSVMRKIRQILEGDRLAVDKLWKQSVTVEMLRILIEFLKSKRLKESCRESILDLLAICFRVRPDRDTLKVVIQLCVEDGSNQNCYLQFLLKLLSDCPTIAACFLRFPQKAQPTRTQSMAKLGLLKSNSMAQLPFVKSSRIQVPNDMSGSLGYASRVIEATGSFGDPTSPFQGISSFLSLMANFGADKRKSEIAQEQSESDRNLLNPFVIVPVAAVAIPLRENISFRTGIGASVWLRCNKPLNHVNDSEVYQGFYAGDEDRLLKQKFAHVISVGSGELRLSLWLSCITGDLVALMYGPGDQKAERLWKDLVPLGRWTHVAVGLKFDDIYLGNDYIGGTAYASVYLNGMVCRDITLGCTSVEAISRSKAFLFAGYRMWESSMTHISDVGTLDVGSIMLFDRLHLRQEHSLILTSLGPDCETLLDTRVKTCGTDLSSFLKPQLIEGDINIGQLIDERMGLLEELQKTISLSYTVTRPDVFYNFNDVKGGSNDNCSIVPAINDIYRSCELTTLEEFSLDEALMGMGGMSVFLFLFGRTAELSQNPVDQALALRLLLTAARRSSKFWQQFDDVDGYSLITTALVSEHFVKSDAILKELIVGAVSYASKRATQLKDSSFLAESQCRAVIRDPILLKHAVLDFDIWKSHLEVWERGLQVVINLIEPQNCHHYFNRDQLNRSGFLKQLLMTVVAIFNEVGDLLPARFYQHFNSLVKNLLSSPPETSSITSLWDFLFLTHSASWTYVAYKVVDFSEWLQPALFNQEVLAADEEGSHLRVALENLFLTIGRSQVSQLIQKEERSPRWIFEHYLSLSQSAGLQTIGEKNSTAEVDSIPIVSISNLPDLVCHTGGFTLRISTDIKDVEDQFHQSSNDQSVSSAEDAEGKITPQSPHSLMSLTDPVEGINVGKAVKKEADVGEEVQSEVAWMNQLRSGLLGHLLNILSTVPEPLFQRVVGPVIKWEHLLVMLQHQKEPLLRNACVKLICCVLLRMDETQKGRFNKSFGFALLANQLAEFPVTQEQTDAIFSVLIGRIDAFDLGEQDDLWSSAQPDRFYLGALKSVLVLLVRSAHSPVVFQSVCGRLDSILSYNYPLAKGLLEQNLMEAACAALLSIVELKDKEKVEELVKSWDFLVRSVLFRCLVRGEVIHTSGVTDLLNLLIAADKQIGGQKNRQLAHLILRREVCGLLQFSLECVRDFQYEEVGKVSPTSQGLERSDSTGYLDAIRNFGSQFNLFSPESGQSEPSPYGSLMRNTKSHAGSRSNLTSPTTKSLQQGFSLRSLSRRNSVVQMKSASQNEVLQRFYLILQAAVDPFLRLAPLDCKEEEEYFEFLLTFLLGAVKSNMMSKEERKNNTWASLLWAARDKIRLYFSHFVLFILYPPKFQLSRSRGQETADVRMESIPGATLPQLPEFLLRRRLLILESLVFDSRCAELIRLMTEISSVSQSAVNLALHDILFCWGSQLNDLKRREVDSLLRTFRHQKGVNWLLEKACVDGIEAVNEEDKAWLFYWQLKMSNWLRKMTEFVDRLKQKQLKVAKPISEEAMKVTCSMVEEQNYPRKLFIQYNKGQSARELQARNQWKRIATDLCHLEGIFFHHKSHASSWVLDFTEGPNRERRRLRNGFLSVDRKFLTEESKWKVDCESVQSPLTSILESSMKRSVSEPQLSYASALMDRLSINEKIVYTSPASIITPFYENFGELLLGDFSLFFIGESSHSSQKSIARKDLIHLQWSYTSITEVYKRWYLLADTALELFIEDGETYLIAFSTAEKRDEFMQRLMSMELPNLTVYSQNLLQTLTQWWREGSITNFEYLMHLNKLSGRTYSDLMQYPVFPWVLSDYTSEFLDLTNPNCYRNLSKPMAIQDKTMENHYVKVYKTLEADYKKAQKEGKLSTLPHFGPYHYGSHYSNSGVVLHYLVRLPPFTRIMLEYQDNSFDLPDRSFHSISTTWRLASSESTSDFKELIPEFFFLPEFLRNHEGFHMGVRQNGMSVANVNLPGWCYTQDPRMFILIHRQALESNQVTGHLHNWIDLVFGFKQNGPAAIESINVFHPATYFGMALDSLADEVQQCALKAMVRTYGQMPKQIFKTPHLPHLTVKHQRSEKSPIPSVTGIKWGSYVGAQDTPEPVVILRQRCGNSFQPSVLFPLANNGVVGLNDVFALVVGYKTVQKEISLAVPKEVETSWLISWEFTDGIIRGRCVSPTLGPWVNLFAPQGCRVTVGHSLPGTYKFLLGFQQGFILVFSIRWKRDKMELSCKQERSLWGHNAPISSIATCAEYSIIVSGADNGECYQWDLNRLTFVRSLSGHQQRRVELIAISRTMGDIASVSHIGETISQVVVKTINGADVRTIETDSRIRSLCFSSAPEGISVNALVAGTEDGSILFWDTWTLQMFRDIRGIGFTEPLVSVCFSHNCQKLYACTKSGTIVCWETPSSTRSSRGAQYVPLYG